MSDIKYKRLDPITHVIERSSMYCGSRELQDMEDYLVTLDDENRISLEKKSFRVSPALLRCFLEILYNATDNKERDTKDVKQSEISINIVDDRITIKNNGAVIPIKLDETEGVYNHTMIFGTLLTGSNYDDSESRTTVGQNGMGAKLTNIFSKEFTVVGVDPVRQLRFEQTWMNNMRDAQKAKITKCLVKKGFTKVSFVLDLDLFPNSKRIPTELFMRYAMDASMTMDLKVVFDDVSLSSKPECYLSMISQCEVLKISPEIYVTAADPATGFEHISFVNGLRTRDGGRHVDAAVEAVCRPVMNRLKIATLRDIKPLFRFLVISKVINPEFNGQEKHCLMNPSVKYAPISTTMISKLMKLKNIAGEQIKSLVNSFQNEKDKKMLAKTIASKSLSIEGYDKANFAGGSKSMECTLFITEGKSAKPLAVRGIEYGFEGKKGRDYFGIFPLTGKILNTRNASNAAISKNTVIMNLVKIIGLDFSKPLNFSGLKYGKVCILADADDDGIHIEGLLLNFFHYSFPGLLDIGFVKSMKTPIFKIVKSGEFYFDEMSLSSIPCDTKIKYYKGLGTIKPEDVKSCFGKKVLDFRVDDETGESFQCAFSSSNSSDRKEWIKKFSERLDDRGALTLDDMNDVLIPYSITDHLRYQVVKYFFADCARTLPNIMDGFKESQRKIVYTLFKLKLEKDEMKVAQLGARVALETQYHHGENNLFSTIIKMAQSFVGSNNMPLLKEEGTFGTRVSGGDDAAQPRYIFTKMSPICRRLFPSDDVYTQLSCEGSLIEPQFYVPILPLILINGCVGIASGWMCSCPCFNPDDVIANSRLAMNGQQLLELKPWYRDFKGEIVDVGKGRFETRGIYTVKNLKSKKIVTVTELPIGMWNENFDIMMENCQDIRKITNKSNTTDVLYELETSCEFDADSFMKKMLITKLNVNNIVGFDSDNTIVKVSVDDIFRMWARERLQRNEIRKERILKELKIEQDTLKERILFISLVKNKTLNLTCKEDVLIKKMNDYEITDLQLLNLSVRQLTDEKRVECEKKLTKIIQEIQQLEKMSAIDIWESDLKQLKTAMH